MELSYKSRHRYKRASENKTLGRARDTLTERNMKCLSQEDRELIRRARRDGREARGNEEREKRED